tara:strand:- start:81 stop:281 length:201 start_codon:yes stop_codon:yes gene_type:complete
MICINKGVFQMKAELIDLIVEEERKKREKEKQFQEYLYLDIPYTDCEYDNNTRKKEEPRRVIIIDL